MGDAQLGLYHWGKDRQAHSKEWRSSSKIKVFNVSFHMMKARLDIEQGRYVSLLQLTPFLEWTYENLHLTRRYTKGRSLEARVSWESHKNWGCQVTGYYCW